MPRDLFSSEANPQPLVASPESQTPKADGSEGSAAEGSDGYNQFVIYRGESRNTNLHPYVQTLSLSNLESCIALDNAVFPEQKKVSREKFTYRLSTCPELCLGIFSTLSAAPSTDSIPTYDYATPPDSHSPDRKSVLIAMIIATKTDSPAITDESIDFPPHWQQPSSSSSSSSETTNGDPRGHHEKGRTIAVHTMGVLPAYQGRGLGRTIMKSYQQRMETSGIADRIALLAHEPLVKMFVGMGFEDRGESACTVGAGGWSCLIYDFSALDPSAM